MFANRVLYTFSPAEYSKHNCQLDLGQVSSVATNKACVEQIIVPYLGTILLNCFSKMLLSNFIVIVFAR